MSSIFANEKTISLDFNILMILFAVIISFTVASLTELLITFTACAISGLS